MIIRTYLTFDFRKVFDSTKSSTGSKWSNMCINLLEKTAVRKGVKFLAFAKIIKLKEHRLISKLLNFVVV